MEQITSKILTIAGSDSCGGAGIEADIKTATALKTYATSTITCITAQSTAKVFDIFYSKPAFIKKQISVVLDDVKIDAIKIGMLGNEEITLAVAEILKEKAKNIPIILDPVMVATSGDSLLTKNSIRILKEKLIPLSFLITPNIPEAEILAEMKIKNLSDVKIAAQKISKLGAKNILIKGGHLKNNSSKIHNFFLDKNGIDKIFTNKKLSEKNIHGTGCTLSSALACFISKKYDLQTAISKANRFVYEAIKHGKKIGKGSKILNHFF